MNETERPRVLHFVTGGGSGATRVALDLALGHLRTGNFDPLLVLRRKRASLPAIMQRQIDDAGLATAWVDNWPKLRTLRQLTALIAQHRPQVVAAHGNSEHIWGRIAASRARVPVIVHIEQNLERYPFWRIWRARRLAVRTSATVAVSQGVASRLRQLGLAASRLEIIHNGIEPSRLSADAPPWNGRPADCVMVARFAWQKDHATLVRAARLLVDRGWTGRLLLAGGGKTSHRRSAEALVRRLQLRGRVEFLGRVDDLPRLLHRCRISVLSTRLEGLPLALVESMAAGCATIGSEVSGVTDVIRPDANGWLFPTGDHLALAATIERVLAGGPAIEAVVRQGVADATAHFSVERVLGQYEKLFRALGTAHPQP